MKRPGLIKIMDKHKINFLSISLNHVELVNVMEYIQGLEARIKEVEENHTFLPLLPSDGEIKKEGQKRFDDTNDPFYDVESFYEGVSWLKSQIKGIPGELSDEDAVIIAELIAKGQYESSKVFWKKVIQHFKEK